ncbi:MAG: hypothetical protein E6G83_04125 [Alphaproteobacteria bacterium]|nr:MAG: hypothetical protein E6G83_04125 [Alphaproteobacteria bacterium]
MPVLRWRELLAAVPLAFTACAQSPEILVAFRTEQQAQEHCPKDTVVWVDPQSGGYHLNTSPSYGHAGAGRYACRREAELAGMRAMAN